VRSKLLLSYNIRMPHQETYMRFVVNDFIPALQSVGLSNIGVWHTAYGNYPIRLLVFVAESSDAMDRALGNVKFEEMESKLKAFVTDYTRRVVPFDSRFQF
jgi:hypothetical protein